jgi:hypothetical protein
MVINLWKISQYAVVAGVVALSTIPVPADARGRRVRPSCCSPCVPCIPTADQRVCPQYIWMNHGSYYSFYAIKCEETHSPVNYDSTDAATFLGCQSNCPYLFGKTSTEVEEVGYGSTDTDIAGPIIGSKIPNGDNQHIKVKESKTIFVRFVPKNGKDEIIAQVWKVDVSVTSAIGTDAILTRGTQVSTHPTGATVYPVSMIASDEVGMSILPAAGGHAHVLTCGKGSPLGECKVSIVSHRSAPGH